MNTRTHKHSAYTLCSFARVATGFVVDVDDNDNNIGGTIWWKLYFTALQTFYFGVRGINQIGGKDQAVLPQWSKYGY